MNLAKYVPAVVAVALSACAIQRSQLATQAQASMIGLTKEQVLSCMGPAANKASEGSVEVWSYPSGNNHVAVAASAAYGFASGVSERRFCTVNVTIEGAYVTRVNYVGPTGGLLSPNEQCAFAVQNCAR